MADGGQMKWILPAILLFLSCRHEPLHTRASQTPAAVPAGISATVVSNNDGDSLTVMMNGQKDDRLPAAIRQKPRGHAENLLIPSHRVSG